MAAWRRGQAANQVLDHLIALLFEDRDGSGPRALNSPPVRPGVGADPAAVVREGGPLLCAFRSYVVGILGNILEHTRHGWERIMERII